MRCITWVWIRAIGDIMIKESTLNANAAVYQKTVLAGDYFIHRINKGQSIRIVDLHGNQAADTLFYNADDPSERYSATDTIRAQGNLYLTAGTVLKTNEDNDLLKITADTCGRHDTVGGACATESNTVRYDLEKRCINSL